MKNLNLIFFSVLLFAFGCSQNEKPSSTHSDQSTTNAQQVSEKSAGQAIKDVAKLPAEGGNSPEVTENVTETKTVSNDGTSTMTTKKASGNSNLTKTAEKATKVVEKTKVAAANTEYDEESELSDRVYMEEAEPSSTVVKLENKANAAKDKAVAAKDKAVEMVETSRNSLDQKAKEAVQKTKETAQKAKETLQKASLSHSVWNDLLSKYVTSAGKVNYKGFKNSKAELDAYTALLAANPVQDNWSRYKKLAYWINAYNAFTVTLIVNNYPVSSITDLEGGKPWDKQWIKLGSKTYSLNQIENDIIRPQFKEPRIHFAVNCAAISCPKLLNKAWTETNIEGNFEKQTKAFVNNTAMNSIKAGEVEVSKIFEWYAADFGDLIQFLDKYSEIKIDKGAKVKYKEYNWKLNE